MTDPAELAEAREILDDLIDQLPDPQDARLCRALLIEYDRRGTELARMTQLAERQARLLDQLGHHVVRTGPPLPLGPGEGDEEVWIPPHSDCMERRPDKPCPHCAGDHYHHRTRRCGNCGRRP